MIARIRYYLDENLPVAIVVQLSRRNIEAVTVRDLGWLGAEDINHLTRATEMGYVLCANDADYLQLASDGAQHSGIADWVTALELIHAILTPNDMINHIEFL